MFNFIFSNKDTTITNATIDGTSHTSSNSGYSEILELYHLTESTSNRGNSRILMQFDLTAHSQSIAAGNIPTSSVQYVLKLKNARHHETLPSSFDVLIFPLSRSWDEGNGLSNFDEGLKDEGYANWNNAQLATNWSITGSDYISSSTLTASQHFDIGDEDLEVDVSNIIYAWLTGGIQNNGFLIRYSDYHETGSADLYVKKFFSRHAHVIERQPRLESRWANIIQDDRNNMYYQVSGSLMYYRTINGLYQNLPGQVFVDIVNSSSTVVQTLTASNISTGIYQISGAFINFTSSTSIFRDVWFSSSTQYFTGNFSLVYATGSIYFEYDKMDIFIPNIKSVYSTGERAKWKILAKQKNYNSSVVLSGAVTFKPVLLQDAYISVVNVDTDEILMDFSTGSNKYSKLSYDGNGNYFELYMNSFIPDSLYKIKILANYNNEQLIFDKNWIFKVKK